MRLSLPFASLLAILALSRSVIASPLAVRYDAAPSCPPESTFVSDLMSRVDRIRQPSPSHAPWQIRVLIRADGAHYVGEMTVDGFDGTTTTRHVEGPGCREVVSTLALIAAVTIEAIAEARAAEREPAVVLSAQPDGTDAGKDTLTSPSRAATPANSSDWATGARFMSMGAVAPAMVQGAATYVGYEPVESGLDSRVRLSLGWIPRQSFEVDGSPAEIGWLGFRLDSCPARMSLGSAALLAPCVTAGLGRLDARGDFDGGRASSSTWVDVGLSAELELPVYASLVAGLQGAVIAPLTRNTLVFDGPHAVVHDTPAVGAFLAAGAAMRFP